MLKKFAKIVNNYLKLFIDRLKTMKNLAGKNLGAFRQKLSELLIVKIFGHVTENN